MKKNKINMFKCQWVTWSILSGVHCSRRPFLLWSISLRMAKGSFSLVGSCVVVVARPTAWWGGGLAMGGSRGCKASVGACASMTEGFPLLNTGVGVLEFGLGSDGSIAGVMGSGPSG